MHTNDPLEIESGRHVGLPASSTQHTPLQRLWSWTTQWRLPPALRKTILVLHICSGISWMGVDLALLVLLIIARTTDDPTLVLSGFTAIGMIVPAVIPPLSLAILATGLSLGLGTRWGLLRYWWVLIKLVLSLVMTVLVFVSLVPAVSSIAVDSTASQSAEALRASLGALPTMLFFPPIVSFLMLGIATVLSIFKPWRTTPWSREYDAAHKAR
jgi:hypothetical protein